MNILSRTFDLERKHIFILSSAGKPIFSRIGDEQELVTTFGLLQAIVSIVNDSGDALKVMKSKDRTIVYFIKGSLYFVAISSTREPESILHLQLEFLYSQILVVLTDRVHDILTVNQSKDVRDLLGPESSKLFKSSCNTDITPPHIAFQYVKTFAISYEFRSELNANLKRCVELSNSALGAILYEDLLVSYFESSLNLGTQDLQLLCNFICNASSLRSHDQNMIPICLPNFHSKAYTQAYVCKFTIRNMERSMDLLLVLIASVSESSAFTDIHQHRLVLEKEICKLPVASKLILALDDQTFPVSKYLSQAICLHILYKYRNLSKDGSLNFNQGVASDFDSSLESADSKERIWVSYQRLALTMRAGSSLVENSLPTTKTPANESDESSRNKEYESHVMGSIPLPDHALNYLILNTGMVIVGLASPESELFVTFPGTVNALDACGLTKFLLTTLKSVSTSIFIT